ncbi:ABC transporter ATP-binding protein [Chloroflexota bacterium]
MTAGTYSSVNTPLLQLVDLQTHLFTRGKVVKAVDHVNLTIHKGEALGLVGESGSGKTMTGLSIMRLLPRPVGRIVGGNIYFRGTDIVTLPEKKMQKIRGSQIAMILQDPLSSLNPVLTIGDQMGEPLREHRVIERKGIPGKVLELLRMVNISLPERRASSYPHQFSGGMRQRVVGALAFSCTPDLIIADEPTTALDETIQAQYLRLLKDLQQKHNTSMLFITHDFGIVAKVCDRIAVMYAGRIVEQGKVREVFTNPAHPYTKALLQALPSPFHDVERLPSIAGQPPNLDNLPPGCAFSPRCEHMFEKCTEVQPEEVEIKPGHGVRCYLYDSN